MNTLITRARILMNYDRFQWVVYQLKELRNCRKPSQITRTLATLPRTLNDTYDRALSNVDETSWEDVLKILVLMAYSLQPLPLEALAEVTAIDLKTSLFDPDDRVFDTSSICTMCPSLISPNYGAHWLAYLPNREHLTFNHFSIKEYLTSNITRAGRAAQYPAVAEAYGMIAEMYLIYLLHVFDFEGEVDKARIDQKFPLTPYASSWRFYALRAEPANDGVNKAAMALVESSNVLKNLDKYNMTTQKGSEPATPFWTACLADDFEVPPKPLAPLWTACEAGLTVVAQKLLDQGADIHGSVESLQWPPLHSAIYKGRSSLLQMLLQNGAADTLEKVEKALKSAVTWHQLDCIKVLVDYGADVNTPIMYDNNSVSRSLLYASISNPYTSDIEMVRFLLDHGAKPSEQDGRLEMQQAVEIGRLDIAKMLFVRGMKVSADALRSADLDDPALVQWLLDNGADVNVLRDDHDDKAVSVLRSARERGLYAVADMLDKHGAVLDMNLRCRHSHHRGAKTNIFVLLAAFYHLHPPGVPGNSKLDHNTKFTQWCATLSFEGSTIADYLRKPQCCPYLSLHYPML